VGGRFCNRAQRPTGIPIAASPVRELYVSPNGDRWILGVDNAGKLVVCHHPNEPSGGLPSEIGVDVFLSHGGDGPEHQALAEALANMEKSSKQFEDQRLAVDTIQKLDRALHKPWRNAGVF
jgi:hypothetical protein